MTPEDRAWLRARRYSETPHYRNAYYRGALAAIKNQPIDANPYKPDPKKSWRVAYRRAWTAGHRSVR